MKIKKPLFILSAAAIVFSVIGLGHIQNLRAGIADNILRLHIVADGNSAYSQLMKICVRDRILADFSEILSSCSSLEEAKATAFEHLSEIKYAAENELRLHGCHLPVSAEVASCRFPTKVYGNAAFPGGEYTALNIKIGEAMGQNWWCVLYPPLCITDKTIIMNEPSAEKLRQSLTPEEYRLITETNTPDIKIKFKIAEILGKYFK